MTNVKYLTTKEVARLCHVSDATVKRWQDAALGLVPHGGLRRLAAKALGLDDIYLFARKAARASGGG